MIKIIIAQNSNNPAFDNKEKSYGKEFGFGYVQGFIQNLHLYLA